MRTDDVTAPAEGETFVAKRQVDVTAPRHTIRFIDPSAAVRSDQTLIRNNGRIRTIPFPLLPQIVPNFLSFAPKFQFRIQSFRSFHKMADCDPNSVPIVHEEETEAAVKEREEEQQRLRYLEFVHLAAIQALLCMAKIYAYAKESAGPLKPGVQSVEGTVKTVVGPVVDKYHDAPLQLLKIVDRKVDESVQELQRHVPSVVKEAPAVARSVASEVHKAGLVGSAAGLARSVYARCEPTAKGMIAKYEPAAEQYAASAWRSLNRLPLVPQVAQVVVPAAAQLTERYNRAVCYSAEKGYAVSNYLPLVPTERIAKVFAAGTATAH